MLDLLLPDWCFFLLSLPSRLRCWPDFVVADADADSELSVDDIDATEDSDDMEIMEMVDEAEVSVVRCNGFVAERDNVGGGDAALEL